MTGEELKNKRKERGWTQQELADMLPVTRKTVISYEKMDEVPPAMVTLINQVMSQNVTEETIDAIPVFFDQFSIMMVPLVNQYAQAGYLNGFGDEEYIEELPKIPFAADREHKGEYLCFEVKGDSMDDGSFESYLEGDILLCRNVRQEFWKSKLHIRKWNFVIVHKDKGILVKKIINHDVENGIITLHSLNEYYEDFEVDLRDVAKIFNIVEYRRNERRR